jgi:hypothetical protein
MGAVMALTLGVSVFGASSTGAAVTPVNASGSLHCVVTGKGKFVPPLILGGTTPATFTTKLKSSSCSGSSGVTSFKATLSMTMPTNDCLELLNIPASTLGPAKLKGAAKYNPTTINFTTASATVTDPITMSLPGPGSSSATGSFAGQTPTMYVQFDQGVEALTNNCQVKTKGLKGSGGLKKLSFKLNTNSFIDIPA